MTATRAKPVKPPRYVIERRVAELEAALRLMVRAYESILPGVRFIAVQDYALLNDAPVAAARALGKGST